MVFTVNIVNAATRKLSSLSVQLSIYEPDGSLVGAGSGSISKLNPRAKGTVQIAYTMPPSAPLGVWMYSVYLSRAGTLLDQKTDGSFTVDPAIIAGSIVSVSDAPDPVARGKTVKFAVTVENTGNVVWSSASITIKIYRPDGTLLATPLITVKIQPGVYTYQIAWKVPSSAPRGIWHYEVYVNYASILIGSSTDPSNTITVK